MISDTAKVFPNVSMGPDCEIEDHVIIGTPLKGPETDPPTVLGSGCRIRSFTVIYSGNRIGDRFQTGNKANIREFNVIGNDVSIGTLSIVEHHVRIGDGTRVHSQAFIPEHTVIGSGCWIGPNAVITNARFPNTPRTKDRLEGVVMEDGARIGANSTILPGIRLGKGCLIGAGSVVTRDTLPQGLYYGNPATRHGWICTCGNGLDGPDRSLSCPDCGRTYRMIEGRLEGAIQ